MRKLYILLIAMFLFASCSIIKDNTIGQFDTKNWYKKGSTFEESNVAITECNDIADKRFGGSVFKMVDKNKYIKRCMRQKGYYEVLN